MKNIVLSKIKNLRQEHGFTLEYVAKVLGYKSVKGYYEVETGRIKLRIEHIEKLSSLYNIPMENFFK